jgi:hypothetical protein
MTNTRAIPSNRRGWHPRGQQPEPHITLPDGDEFWPIGGVACGDQETEQLLADHFSVPTFRGRR